MSRDVCGRCNRSAMVRTISLPGTNRRSMRNDLGDRSLQMSPAPEDYMASRSVVPCGQTREVAGELGESFWQDTPTLRKPHGGDKPRARRSTAMTGTDGAPEG